MTAAAVAAQSDLRAQYWLGGAVLAVLAVIAADYWRDRPLEPLEAVAPLDPADLRAGMGPATFAEALATVDRDITGARLNVEEHPGEWLRMERLARALSARYRLTGSATDLAEADRVLARATEIAPWPAGPMLSRAGVSLAAHDLDEATRALDRFAASASPPDAADRAEANSFRCEIAYQRGRLAEARSLCSQGDHLSLQLRRANLAAKSGDARTAARLIEDLLRRPGLSAQTLATLSLQRASVALAQGDWQGSGRWSRAAERIFPGYWLSEAFVAQQLALEGDREEAARRYAALVERTRNPDVLDALARLAVADGRTEDAARWVQRAGAAWRDRSALLPLAYAGHYSEHLLLYGDERTALNLVRADYRRRPHPATIVHYALALWRNGNPARALEVVRWGEDQGFMTAEMKLAEATALAAQGKAAEAAQVMAEARRLNPQIDSFRQQFVAFAQD